MNNGSSSEPIFSEQWCRERRVQVSDLQHSQASCPDRADRVRPAAGWESPWSDLLLFSEGKAEVAASWHPRRPARLPCGEDALKLGESQPHHRRGTSDNAVCSHAQSQSDFPRPLSVTHQKHASWLHPVNTDQVPVALPGTAIALWERRSPQSHQVCLQILDWVIRDPSWAWHEATKPRPGPCTRPGPDLTSHSLPGESSHQLSTWIMTPSSPSTTVSARLSGPRSGYGWLQDLGFSGTTLIEGPRGG